MGEAPIRELGKNMQDMTASGPECQNNLIERLMKAALVCRGPGSDRAAVG